MRFRFTVFILTLVILFPAAVRAEDNYPRLANYFLKWTMTEAEAKELSRWNLVILDMENQENNPELIRKIRQLNPQVKILAYITSQEIIDNPENYEHAWLRQSLSSQIIDSWRLKDDHGNKVVNWPSTSMLNLSDRAGRNSDHQLFNEFLPRFVRDNIKSSGLWDGVFYDNFWGDVSWVNAGNLDFDNDGEKETALVADSLWTEGNAKLLRLTRELCGPDFLILGNGRIYWPYQSFLNGMMLEGFPSSWENGGTWAGSMASYVKLPTINASPALPIINTYAKNQENYQRFRYGLASTLLDGGYYSFDYDVTNHGQTWWYDEYNVNLGTAQSAPFNLLNNGKKDWQPGLWRRDFKNGVAIVNSTDKIQSFFFSKEELEKIKGQQDPVVNNGLKINYLKLNPQDGIILLKKLTAWQGSSFTNGSFLRVFNNNGQQARNGFFSYVASLPAGSEVVVGNFLDNSEIDYIFSTQGKLSRQRSGKIIWTVQPFAAGFQGSASIAFGDINGDGLSEIIIGAGPGGGPQVRIFSLAGRPLLNFFAYDKNFRGGVNVAAGDINGDGRAEIITGAGPGGGPQVRIFNSQGLALSSFFAYEQSFRKGIKVGFSLQSGQPEIAVGIKSF